MHGTTCPEFSQGQGLAKQILNCVYKSDLPLYFLTGLYQLLRQNYPLSQSHFLPFFLLLLSQLISLNCLQNDSQLCHSFQTWRVMGNAVKARDVSLGIQRGPCNQ